MGIKRLFLTFLRQSARHIVKFCCGLFAAKTACSIKKVIDETRTEQSANIIQKVCSCLIRTKTSDWITVFVYGTISYFLYWCVHTNNCCALTVYMLDLVAVLMKPACVIAISLYLLGFISYN